MCDQYWKPISHGSVAFATLLMLRMHTDEFACGEVIPLWNGKFTFSYHVPGKELAYNDYEQTLRLFDTEGEANDAMANFVYGLNTLRKE